MAVSKLPLRIMSLRAPRKVMQHLGLALIMGSAAGFVEAQTPGPVGPTDTPQVLKALDQVIEQNRKLEQQNRELMEQVNTLRQKLAGSAGLLHNPAPRAELRRRAPPRPKQHAAQAQGTSSSQQSEANKMIEPASGSLRTENRACSENSIRAEDSQ